MEPCMKISWHLMLSEIRHANDTWNPFNWLTILPNLTQNAYQNLKPLEYLANLTWQGSKPHLAWTSLPYLPLNATLISKDNVFSLLGI